MKSSVFPIQPSDRYTTHTHTCTCWHTNMLGYLITDFRSLAVRMPVPYITNEKTINANLAVINYAILIEYSELSDGG